MNKLGYKIEKNGIVSACGYDIKDNLIDETTPFQNIDDYVNWRKINDVWEWFDYTWTYENFKIRVTISETIILNTTYYSNLRDAVLELTAYGFAAEETINNNRVMYFNQLQPDHRTELEKDINVIIEEK